MLFANDTALLSATGEQAQQQLNACEHWSTDHGITFNLLLENISHLSVQLSGKILPMLLDLNLMEYWCRRFLLLLVGPLLAVGINWKLAGV